MLSRLHTRTYVRPEMMHEGAVEAVTAYLRNCRSSTPAFLVGATTNCGRTRHFKMAVKHLSLV
jgi:hypothetical protein